MTLRATFWGRFFYVVQYSCLTLLLLADQSPISITLVRILAAVQLLVSIQLLLLGAGLYKEERSRA